METALYLLPVTLGDTPVEKVLPSYNKEIISGIRHFIVEDIRSARRFLKKVDREIDIDALTFYLLNKHTSPEDISGYLKPLVGGASMGVEALPRSHSVFVMPLPSDPLSAHPQADDLQGRPCES